MCRLLGFIGKPKALAGYLGGNKNSLLQQSYSTPSSTGGVTDHRDGWGIWWRNKDTQFYHTFGKEEFDDNEFLSISLEVTAEIAIGHVRKASDGTPVTRAQSQPLVKDGIILAHNGTVFPYVESGKPEQLSDSQVLLEKLHQTWSTRDYKGLVVALFNIITEIDKEYTAMNMIISNEKDLFVLSHHREKDKHFNNYYTMYYKQRSDYIIIGSQVLDEDCLEWEPLENHTLLHIKREGIVGKTSLTNS